MIEPQTVRRETGIGERLSVVLGGGELAPAHVEAALEGYARDIDSEQLALLKLLIRELVTNSILHGGAGPTDEIYVQITVSTRRLHGEVSDTGAGFRCADPRVPRAVGGSGLVSVDRAASRWGTTDGGRRVWFELDRGQPERRPELGGARVTDLRRFRRRTARQPVPHAGPAGPRPLPPRDRSSQEC